MCFTYETPAYAENYIFGSFQLTSPFFPMGRGVRLSMYHFQGRTDISMNGIQVNIFFFKINICFQVVYHVHITLVYIVLHVGVNRHSVGHI